MTTLSCILYNRGMTKEQLFTNIKAIIFDLDGTLVDSMSLWHDIDIEFFKRYGMEVPEGYVEKISHMNFMEMAKYTHDAYGFKESPHEIAEIWTNMAIASYSHTIKAKDNAKAFLAKLKEQGYKIGLATTNKASLYEPCLRNNDMWQYFDDAIDVNSLKSSKKEPLIYQTLAERFGATPEETLVFEDILTAATTVKNANFRLVVVDDKANSKDKDELLKLADYYLYNYNELL